MKIYLSVFLKYMDTYEIRLNLLEFNSVDDLDKFTTKYNDSNEIKKMYQSEIEEFILDYRKSKSYGERKDGIPKTYLSAYYLEDNQIKFIKILYKKTKNDFLLVYEDASLMIGSILKTIKNKFSRYRLSTDDLKVYLEGIKNFGLSFSYEDLYLLKMYISGFERDVYLIKFLKNIKKRIRLVYSNAWCTKLGLKSKKEKVTKPIIKDDLINDIENDMAKMNFISDQITSSCVDDYFIHLVESENYDEMFNNYDIDKILKYSKDKENPIGLRR